MFIRKVITYALGAVFFFGAFFVFEHTAHAGPQHNVSGWGWSSTIGWISLNCTDLGSTGCVNSDYGVAVDTSESINEGMMSGYAWSPYIGWISFNNADTATVCPTPAPARINMMTGNATGWARALAGSNASGWNGCISLSGTGPAYGLALNSNTGNLSGFVWGSTVVGWVQINAIVNMGAPALTLTATPATLPSAGTTTLAWTGANVQPNSCSAPWTVQTGSIGSQSNVSVPVTTTFSITCQGMNNAPITATAAVTVTASAALVLQANPMAVQSSNPTTDLSWTTPNQTQYAGCTRSASPTASGWGGPLPGALVPNSTNGYTHSLQNITVPTSQSSTTYTLVCTDVSGNQSTATAVVTVFDPTPSVSLSANPSTLPQGGGNATLTWTAAHVSSCVASANPGGWAGSKSVSGGSESVALVTTTQYTITCQSQYNPPEVIASTTVYVTGSPLCPTCTPQVPPKPIFEEF